MDKIYYEVVRAMRTAYDNAVNQLMEENKCVAGDTSPEQDAKIDDCISTLAGITTDILWQNRKRMTLERAKAILQKYVCVGLENGALSTEIIDTLKEDCGCTAIELEELDLEWL